MKSWDEYFMSIAYLVSMKSKDVRTRVGAVIVGVDNEIRSTGYNGFPRGISDDLERYKNPEYKDMIICHAEESAILNLSIVGTNAKGCRMYTPWIPCSRCARLIIQSRIKEVIFDPNFPGNKVRDDWSESIEISKELFKESGVILKGFTGKLIKTEILYKGVIYSIF
ncbi:dCMP deaminase family protein [Candidatus Cyrtobacter comes]|uniref:dCMP deaminase family protein n=1 Tax=Candidatus Cyrtobacter comes TaxID=675776 RepID=A0ABU5L7Y7_9RICK|nr:dCMP deaminase family protein [Candidatus Cyrtobacter comes]MDZ5762231.1 dCMP deaminase family protein [Candidatus Cyrtobacter comes]